MIHEFFASFANTQRKIASWLVKPKKFVNFTFQQKDIQQLFRQQKEYPFLEEANNKKKQQMKICNSSRPCPDNLASSKSRQVLSTDSAVLLKFVFNR